MHRTSTALTKGQASILRINEAVYAFSAAKYIVQRMSVTASSKLGAYSASSPLIPLRSYQGCRSHSFSLLWDSSYSPCTAVIGSVVHARLAGSAEPASVSSSMARTETVSPLGSNGLTSNKKDRSRREAARPSSRPKTQSKAASLPSELTMRTSTPERWQPRAMRTATSCSRNATECNHGIDPTPLSGTAATARDEMRTVLKRRGASLSAMACAPNLCCWSRSIIECCENSTQYFCPRRFACHRSRFACARADRKYLSTTSSEPSRRATDDSRRLRQNHRSPARERLGHARSCQKGAATSEGSLY
jgi:hypothetical protein